MTLNDQNLVSIKSVHESHNETLPKNKEVNFDPESSLRINDYQGGPVELPGYFPPTLKGDGTHVIFTRSNRASSQVPPLSMRIQAGNLMSKHQQDTFHDSERNLMSPALIPFSTQIISSARGCENA